MAPVASAAGDSQVGDCPVPIVINDSGWLEPGWAQPAATELTASCRDHYDRTMSSSLIPDETLARVGQLLVQPVSVVIDQRESQRYALAVGDENPVYFDEDAARAAGHRTIIAPPTFVTHAIVPPRANDQLRLDGLWKDRGGVRLDVERMMFGGEEWDLLEPVCVGDTITAETRLAGVDQKEGSKGPFVRVVRETTFTNQDGTVVARSRQIGIAR
jgi:acyl dehydratase